MPKARPYTVVSLFADNRQTHVAHVTASTVERAARKAERQMVDAGSPGEPIAVFIGHHRDRLPALALPA